MSTERDEDRALLIAAAKAEGHGVEFDELSGLSFFDNKFTGLLWDPLRNDGDALRLAVKLQLQITPGTYNKDEFTAFHAGHGEAHEYWSTMQDECAATRRAITRAAAEIWNRSTATTSSGEREG